jgi:hypothetical protein
MDSKGCAASKWDRGGLLAMRVIERITPAVAAMSALATLVCCLPLGIAGGVAALGLSVVVSRFQSWLIGLAVILLGVSAVQIFRGRGSCHRRSRLSLTLFGVSALIVIGVVIFPQKIAELIAAIP